jgi:LytS/YehU family sensor histidine kinase
LIYLFSGISLLTVAGESIVWINKKRKESQLQQAQAESEMKALRAQMNPHFMFNALNAIQQLILNQETDLAYRYLGIYGKLTRQIQENSEKKWITVAEEIKFLEWYLKMESFRFDHSFLFEIKTDDEILPNTDRLPAMALQPLVENAIKHGLLPKKAGEKHLEIFFQKPENENGLKIWIEDNGVGRQPTGEKKETSEHRSMSLEINRNRLKLLGNEEANQLEFEDLKHPDGSPAGTRVKLIFMA